jgi:hypothetical protein
MTKISDYPYDDPYGFFDEYRPLYPDADHKDAFELCYLFVTIHRHCQDLADGYKALSSGKRYSMVLDSCILKYNKIYWLFYKMPFESFSQQLQSLMIKRNDLSLNTYDYTLLFYVSLQESELQRSVEGLPLSMLYDIFTPIADANQKKWMSE